MRLSSEQRRALLRLCAVADACEGESDGLWLCSISRPGKEPVAVRVGDLRQLKSLLNPEKDRRDV